jgi:hypothetical protein
MLWNNLGISQFKGNNYELHLEKRLFQMLGRLEYYLQCGRIPFFWDKRSNLIGHLGELQIQNMYGRVTHLKGRLERAISSHDKNNIASVMDLFYPV